MAKSKIIITSGKRKRAIASAALRPGTGQISINGLRLKDWGTSLLRTRVSEPLILSGKQASTVDISVRATGGGVTGQTDAIRLAIGRALTEHDKKLKTVLLEYDRTLLVADIRRKESSKPNAHGKARAKRQKSYR